jgi:hypothetical protein
MSHILKKELLNISIKKEVLTYFFDRINYYEFRYIMLKSLDDLQKNEKNIEYVIPHIKGEPYFLLIGTIGQKTFSYLIEKKKLKFNMDQCNVNEIKIYYANYKCANKTYTGSIFDGRIINDIFLIQDCYYLDGLRMNAWKLEKKLKYIDEYISKNINNQNIKIRNVDKISDIQELDSKISKSTVEINGFIFLQARSGISYIFIDNENFNNKNNNQESNIIVMKPEIKQNIQKENIISNISDENVFLIKKDVKPDVYHVYDKDNNLVHFASIPDTRTSQYVYNILKNIDSAYFKCTLCPIWKRYKPVTVVDS